MTHPIAVNVLDFWFGDWPLTPEENKQRSAVWFVANQDFDDDIERRFGQWVSAARRGVFDSWAAQPDDCLALIIILDQLPRNLYRGQASAFASDTQALALARSLYKSDALEKLGFAERAFALMPYQHAEDLEVQIEGVLAYRQQLDSAPKEWQAMMQGYTDFARQHLDIIEKFGRFPHRNRVLGRENTAEEDEYLNSGGERFGQ